MRDLTHIEDSLKQIVTKPTRGKNILDVELTNLPRCFLEPVIIPPVQPDNDGHGKASDHDGVLVTPNPEYFIPHEKIIRYVRPISGSAIETFGGKFVHEDWGFLDNYCNSTLMTQ